MLSQRYPHPKVEEMQMTLLTPDVASERRRSGRQHRAGKINSSANVRHPLSAVPIPRQLGSGIIHAVRSRTGADELDESQEVTKPRSTQWTCTKYIFEVCHLLAGQ
jgi:hypothetical protein